MKNILKRALIIFLCGFVFLGVAYVYLEYNFKNNTTVAEHKEYTVPYERVPENKNIIFVFANSSALLTHLDFDTMCIRLLVIDEYNGDNISYNGYFVDYTVEVDYLLIEGIVDMVGGINLDYNGEMLRYTGVQVVDLISDGCDNTLKRQIILKIFEQIAKNSFSKDDFVYIIENSKNNLSIIDTIYWLDYLKEMSKKISFIN